MTKLALSRVGLGTAALASTRDPRTWWGSQTRRSAVRTIHAALAAGVNWIDTAPFYGWGGSETLVGAALRGRRDEALLFTKCGTVRAGTEFVEDLRPVSIRADLEASLRRLGADHVDVLQFHDPDSRVPIEESWGELERLIAEGKVRHGGLSNHALPAVRRAHASPTPVSVLQYQYSLLHREIELELLPFAEAARILVLAWSPLASGYLTERFSLEALDSDDFRRRHPFSRLDLGPLRAALRAVGRDRGLTAEQAALAWVLRRRGVRAIVGARSPQEASELAGAEGWALEDRDLVKLDLAVRRI